MVMKSYYWGSCLVPVLLLLSKALSSHASVEIRNSASQNPTGGPIEGSISYPVGVPVPTEARVTLFTPGQTAAGEGRRRRVFPSALDGRFTFDNVGDGMHILDVEAVGFYFPTIKIIKHGNLVKATASDVQDRPVEYPLKLAPLKPMEFFEQKQKFNLMKWLKTPYGIMIAFGVGSLILLPMLKVDPEEYRQMKEMTSMSTKKQ